MADTILNAKTGDNTGNQRLGTITVKLPGRKANSTQHYSPLDTVISTEPNVPSGDSKHMGHAWNHKNIPLSSISGLYQTRFDDYTL